MTGAAGAGGGAGKGSGAGVGKGVGAGLGLGVRGLVGVEGSDVSTPKLTCNV